MIPGNWILRILMLVPVFLTAQASLANKGKPMQVSILKKDIETVASICDSLPAEKTVPENTAENKQTTVIKEVPKSKKQTAPISVTPAVKTVKPIKVIKPKIIKPTIKIN
jgi:hypothetical protein